MSKEFKMGFIEEVEPLKLTTIPKKYQKLIEATENRWFNKIQKLAKIYQKRIDDLEHRLSNCIEPKFKQGDYFIEYWNETPNIYQYEGNKHFKCLNKKQGYHCDYVILGALLLGEDFIKPITEAEAKAKLEELKNG